MAQLYSSGPVSIWVGTNLSSQPQFLGHGESAPEIITTPPSVPFQSDSSGETPANLLDAGETGRVTVTLTRYNRRILDVILSRSRGRNFPGSPPGFRDAGQIGTPLLTNGCAYALYLVFPSAGKATYNVAANGVLPPGYRFLAATLDPDRSVMGTTSAYKILLNWECLMKRDPTRKTSYGKGSWTLYDFDISDTVGLLMN